MLKLLKLKEFNRNMQGFLSLPQWSTKRKAILKRDKFRCRCCEMGLHCKYITGNTIKIKIQVTTRHPGNMRINY